MLEVEVAQEGLDLIEAEAVADSVDARAALELETLRLQRDRLEIENQGLKQDTTERRRYADRVFKLVSVWLLFVMATITAAGLKGYPYRAFALSDGVLIGLLTTSTATVLGVLLIVVRYLFPPRNGNGQTKAE